jgi:hypothetical protein
LESALKNTIIKTSDVAPITALEIQFFQKQQPGDTLADLKDLDKIQKTLKEISSQETISLEVGVRLRTAIDQYLADKPARGVALKQEIGNIPIPGGFVGPLASAVENALAGTSSSSSDQLSAASSFPAVVPFGFLVGLVETAIQLTNPEEARSQNQAFRFVAPLTGQLLVVEVLNSSIQTGVNGTHQLTFDLVVIPAGPAPGSSARFLLQDLTGPSILNSTARPESGLGASGAPLGVADTANPSPNRSPNTVLLPDGGEGLLETARVGEEATRARGFFVLPDEALRPAKLPLDTREEDGDSTEGTGERTPPSPLSVAPEPFAEPAAGLVGNGGSLLPLTPWNKVVPVAGPAPDVGSGERSRPRQADPRETTRAAVQLEPAAVDEAMKPLWFTPGQNVPVATAEVETVPLGGLRENADDQSPPAALGVPIPWTEGTRQAVADVLFGFALSTLLWVPLRTWGQESQRRSLTTR